MNLNITTNADLAIDDREETNHFAATAVGVSARTIRNDEGGDLVVRCHFRKRADVGRDSCR